MFTDHTPHKYAALKGLRDKPLGKPCRNTANAVHHAACLSECPNAAKPPFNDAFSTNAHRDAPNAALAPQVHTHSPSHSVHFAFWRRRNPLEFSIAKEGVRRRRQLQVIHVPRRGRGRDWLHNVGNIAHRRAVVTVSWPGWSSTRNSTSATSFLSCVLFSFIVMPCHMSLNLSLLHSPRSFRESDIRMVIPLRGVIHIERGPGSMRRLIHLDVDFGSKEVHSIP
eukprot:93173-Amphidinium_carterae.2